VGVPTDPVRRAAAVLRRGGAPAGSGPGDPPDGGEDLREALTRRSSLREIEAAAPALRVELSERARAAGLLIVWVAAVVMPLWTLVDRTVAPAQADLFLIVRLIGDVPIVAALWALTRSSLGRRRPAALAVLALAVVQVEIAWMLTQVDDPTYYLLGFTLAIYGSGCILVATPRWTVALIAVSWAALVLSVLIRPVALAAEDLVAGTFYVGTASIIGLLAHVRRSALSHRELLTRVRFEREEQRTATLLAQLERLSHEDPLTGLANRRRWDATLAGACATAR